MAHDSIRAKYTNGALDEEQARQQLEESGLTRLEAERTVDSWTERDDTQAVQ